MSQYKHFRKNLLETTKKLSELLEKKDDSNDQQTQPKSPIVQGRLENAHTSQQETQIHPKSLVPLQTDVSSKIATRSSQTSSDTDSSGNFLFMRYTLI